jgi:hypothetical protein
MDHGRSTFLFAVPGKPSAAFPACLPANGNAWIGSLVISMVEEHDAVAG